MVTQSYSIACPIGGHTDQIQKISSIVAQATANTSLSGYTVGGSIPVGQGSATVDGSRISLGGTSVSLLAKTLSAPVKPVYHSSCASLIIIAVALAVAIYCSGFAALLFLSYLLRVPDYAVGLVITICGILSFGALFAIASIRSSEEDKKKRAQLANEIAQWEIAIEKWKRTYYCFRDDVIFIPGEGTAVPVDKMTEFLRS